MARNWVELGDISNTERMKTGKYQMPLEMTLLALVIVMGQQGNQWRQGK